MCGDRIFILGGQVPTDSVRFAIHTPCYGWPTPYCGFESLPKNGLAARFTLPRKTRSLGRGIQIRLSIESSYPALALAHIMSADRHRLT